MGSKPVLKSKTINFNTIVLGVVGVLQAFDIPVPDGVYPALLAAVPLINILLRFVTKGAVSVTGGNPSGQNGRASVALLAVLAIVGSAALHGCATIKDSSDADQALAGARLIARKAGKYVGRNNPDVAARVANGYAEMAALEGDTFREHFLAGLDWYLEAQGVAGSDELRADAADILGLFGFDIEQTTVDISFLKQFEVDRIKSVTEAFVQGMALAVQ